MADGGKDVQVKIVNSIGTGDIQSCMQQVLEEDLGKDWRKLIKDFDNTPLAAASIGQVHRAVLHDGSEVAMKIQVGSTHPFPFSSVPNMLLSLSPW